MVKLYEVIGKKNWFLLFNIFVVLCLVISGRLRRDVDSIFSYGLALLIVNLLTVLAARRFPNWK